MRYVQPVPSRTRGWPGFTRALPALAAAILLLSVPAPHRNAARAATPAPAVVPARTAAPAANRTGTGARPQPGKKSPPNKVPSAKPPPPAPTAPAKTIPLQRCPPTDPQRTAPLGIGWPEGSLIFIAGLLVLIALWGAGGFLSPGTAWAMIRGEDAGAVRTTEQRQQAQGKTILVIMTVVVLIGVLWIRYIPELRCSDTWFLLEIVAIGMFVLGGGAGFLFGLPMVVDAPAAPGASGPHLKPSTNLEGVVTKAAGALTGAMLVAIPIYGGKFNDFIATHIGAGTGTDQNNPISLLGFAMLAYFPTLGFLFGYILTRTVASRAFANADAALTAYGGKVRTAPVPDLSEASNAELQAAAAAIAAVDYAALSTAAEKWTWARSQAILGHYASAEKAYAEVVVLSPNNAKVVLDYATTIYNDPGTDNIPLVLSLVSQARKLAGPQIDPALESRMLSLEATSHLYLPGGYEQTLAIVNRWILTPAVPTNWLTRFYRACALGQLYRSFADPAAVPPQRIVPGVAPADEIALHHVIMNDVTITLATDPVSGFTQLRSVIDPTSRDRTNPHDDDLQVYAIDHADLTVRVGIAPVTALPTSPLPPRPSPLPLPPAQPIPSLLAVPAGTFAAWIATLPQ